MAIKIDPDKVVIMSLVELNTLAEIVDYAGQTSESSERRMICDRISTHLHMLFMGTRNAIMVDQRFLTLKTER
jgi:hypothetical protein